jgi:membrane dipeptidase
VSPRALATLLLTLAVPVGAAAEEAPTDPALLARARALLERAPLIDGHNDLPTSILASGWDVKDVDAKEQPDPFAGVRLDVPQPRHPADVPRLREGRVGAQFWAAYVSSDFITRGGGLRHTLREIDLIHRMVEQEDALEMAYTADDIERIHASGRIASLIGIEGGHGLEGSRAALRMVGKLGVRYVTLTHWKTTDWADAATDGVVHHGLSEDGEAMVREMNRAGIFVDLSHVSAETMDDALRVSKAPVIFSHSSARALNPHLRNVPDHVLAKMPANGGVVMVNFLSAFIARGAAEWEARRVAHQEGLQAELDDASVVAQRMKEWEKQNPQPRGGVRDVADHIEHIRKVAGVDHVGIGADYWEAAESGMPEGLGNASRYPHLFAELLRRGWSDEDVLKVAGRNLLRAMRAMEKAAREMQGPARD